MGKTSFQVDKLIPIYTSSKSLEKVELASPSVLYLGTSMQDKRATYLLRKSSQARNEAGSRSCGQEVGPGGWRGTQPMAASVLAERRDPGARSAIGTFEDCLGRWGSQSEV